MFVEVQIGKNPVHFAHSASDFQANTQIQRKVAPDAPVVLREQRFVPYTVTAN